MNSIKLAKYLAHSGVASRRKSEELINSGKVKVNGQVEKNVARRVVVGEDQVQYLNKVVEPRQEKIVLAMYKPVGVVSTVSDPDNKQTIIDLLPKQYRQWRLFPVGRLDEDSEGLILLTNDGDLAYKLTHPKFQVPRTYLVTIRGSLTSSELHRLRVGIPLKDGRTGSTDVEIIEQEKGTQTLKITLTEGRNHQIRRMMLALNHHVLKLKRISHGQYELAGLQPGQIREENT